MDATKKVCEFFYYKVSLNYHDLKNPAIFFRSSQYLESNTSFSPYLLIQKKNYVINIMKILGENHLIF